MKFFIKENFNESLATCSGVNNSGLEGKTKTAKTNRLSVSVVMLDFSTLTLTKPIQYIYLFIYLLIHSCLIIKHLIKG